MTQYVRTSTDSSQNLLNTASLERVPLSNLIAYFEVKQHQRLVTDNNKKESLVRSSFLYQKIENANAISIALAYRDICTYIHVCINER